MSACSIFVDSPWETKSIWLHTFLSECRVVTPLEISTSTNKGLESSKVTWTDSSVTVVLLLKTLKVLLEVEYPRNMPSSTFVSKFYMIILPVIKDKTFASKDI